VSPDAPTPEPDTIAQRECPCGESATTTVLVTWADGKRRYRYCEACAADVATYIDGAEVIG
jgi:hypothetical protein